jgi:hypothetical protein
MSYHDFDASYVFMRNKLEKIIILHVQRDHDVDKGEAPPHLRV